jgi:hypothetical protein
MVRYAATGLRKGLHTVHGLATRYRPAARVVAVAVVAAVWAMSGVLLYHDVTGSDSDVRLASAERQGVRYLEPLSRLVDDLVVAQSVSVRGSPVAVNTVDADVVAVDAADRSLRVAIPVHQRWIVLRDRVNALLDKPSSASQAYQDFGDLVGLAVALQVQIGDLARLTLDPRPDSHHLAEVAVLRLPQAMVYAGRAADLLSLAGDGTPRGEDADTVAVARFQVALVSVQVMDGLSKSVKATSDVRLGVTLTPEQDAFQAAVDSFVPPVVVQRLSAPIDGKNIVRAAGLVQESALVLSDAVLGELDALLASRQAEAQHRERMFILVGVGVLAAVPLAVWLLSRPRRRPRLASGRDEDGRYRADEPVPRSPGGPAAGSDLVDAREVMVESRFAAAGPLSPRARLGRRGGDAV